MRLWRLTACCLVVTAAASIAVQSQQRVTPSGAVIYEGARLILGYERFTKAAGEALPENFTPENLLDHLQREAFYGVGTANDGGSAPIAPSLQFQQDQAARSVSPAAQYWFNAGIVPPNGGPDTILIKGT